LEVVELIDKYFWRGKRVFLTGHTGFKGTWLSIWLYSLGAEVKGLALNPPTSPSLFNESRVGDLVESEIGDIRDQDTLQKSMVGFNPDILIHMAAQSLVRYSYNAPIETYEVNVIGTAKVLEVARGCTNLKAIVNITTDKCYENREDRKYGYRENDRLGGHDPYSASKACSELVTASYRKSFFDTKKSNELKGPLLASARAGNVIGGGDWAEDRLIPDIIKAFKNNEKVIIRNPKSTRPWQHVLEPLSGYLKLAEQLEKNGDQYAEAWNFGPAEIDARPVQWIVEKMAKLWGENANWINDKSKHPHEANYLKLDCSKAHMKLNWYPRWDLSETLLRIVEWHKLKDAHNNYRKLCLTQINDYMEDMNK